MITKNELIDWLNSLEDNAQIAIDEGGLMLFEVGAHGGENGEVYIEIGGVPEDYDIEKS